MLPIQQGGSAYVDQIDRNSAAQKGFFGLHKFAIVTGIIAALGLAYLESARRVNERINNLAMKCKFMDCKPNDAGIFPSITSDLSCQCPPPAIATRMKWPADILEHFDYHKEADRVCKEGFDFAALDQPAAEEKVVYFCKGVKEALEADENRKGYYQKFLETMHLS